MLLKVFVIFCLVTVTAMQFELAETPGAFQEYVVFK
jgi:hypothetical protein